MGSAAGKLRAKAVFRLRERVATGIGHARRLVLRMQGARIGRTVFPHAAHVTWPHRLRIGDRCTIEHGVAFKIDGIYAPDIAICIGNRAFIGSHVEFNVKEIVEIGDDCLIASGCRFIDHDNGMLLGQGPMNRQPCPTAPIVLGNDVWLGANVQVLKGVQIGDGAVVAAGAVVTRSTPAGEIWGGVPARKLAVRT